MSTSNAQGSDTNKTDPRIFEDPSISANTQDDPVAKFIRANWKTMATVLVAVALGMLAYDSFKSTAEAKRASATQLFGQIRDNYGAIVLKQQELEKARSGLPADEKAKAEGEQKIAGLTKEVDELRQKTKLMIDSLDSPKPFDLLGRLYGGLLSGRFKDYAGVRSALTNISWEIVGRPGSPERLVAEIATVGLAKMLADSEKEKGDARTTLVALAERGEFAAVQSVMVLASMSTTVEEQSQVRSLIDALRKRLPSQEKFLKEAEEQFG